MVFGEYEASNVVLCYKAPSYYNEKVFCHYKRHTQVLTLDLRGETNGRDGLREGTNGLGSGRPFKSDSYERRRTRKDYRVSQVFDAA